MARKKWTAAMRARKSAQMKAYFERKRAGVVGIHLPQEPIKTKTAEEQTAISVWAFIKSDAELLTLVQEKIQIVTRRLEAQRDSLDEEIRAVEILEHEVVSTH